jgi:hypothetical protein
LSVWFPVKSDDERKHREWARRNYPALLRELGED